jgi:hypothetical protein
VARLLRHQPTSALALRRLPGGRAALLAAGTVDGRGALWQLTEPAAEAEEQRLADREVTKNCAGSAQIVGQAQASDLGSQSRCWAKSRTLPTL